jgi:hypothetical protein
LVAGFFAAGFFAAGFFAGVAGWAGACLAGAFFAFAAVFAIVLSPSRVVRIGANKKACAFSTDLLPGKLTAKTHAQGFSIDDVAQNHQFAWSTRMAGA